MGVIAILAICKVEMLFGEVHLILLIQLCNSMWKHDIGAYADSESPDQPAHSRCLIRAFVIVL